MRWILSNCGDVQSLHRHEPLMQSLQRCHFRRACVCAYVHVVGWEETAPESVLYTGADENIHGDRCC